jgi:hypothetical protein
MRLITSGGQSQACIPGMQQAQREVTMSIELSRGNLTLKRNGIAVLRRSRGVRLMVARGTAWLTIDGESRDVVLHPCDQFVVQSDADVAISAIAGPVEISVRPAAPKPTEVMSVLGSVTRALSRVRGAFAGSAHAAAGVV